MVLTPNALVAATAGSGVLASPLEVLAAWASYLQTIGSGGLPGLFPVASRERGFRWAVATAGLMLRVRDELAQNGLTVADVASRGIDLEEPDRWADFARIEQACTERLGSLGLGDPGKARVRGAATAALPCDIRKVLVAAVPDPMPLSVAALERISESVQIEVLIHAPTALADAFDQWGRPEPAYWESFRLDLPAHSISLEAGPAEAASSVARAVATAERGACAIGVPSNDDIPSVEEALARHGVESFSPAGRKLASHEIGKLLDALAALHDDGSFESLAELVRHPGELKWLTGVPGVGSPSELLKSLDVLQNKHLPETLLSLEKFAGQTCVGAACDAIKGQLKKIDSGDPGEVSHVLSDVYSHVGKDPASDDGRRFRAAAEEIMDILSELGSGTYEQLGLGRKERLLLLREALGSTRFNLERTQGSVDLLGWLELHWEDAPRLVVCGMNDGGVPETMVADPFLPDSLRARLGIRCNQTRFARDAYVLAAILESRKGRGEVQLVVKKATGSGDPLKPSRLLFLCEDQELPARVEMLFGPSRQEVQHVSRQSDWKLRPLRASAPGQLPVTAYKAFLQCPFTFYLARLVGMEPMDDRARELDPLQFGTMCHDSLEVLGSEPGLADATDENAVAAALQARAEHWVSSRFGDEPPAAVKIQLEAASQRLAWAAKVHVEERKKGWRICKYEHRLMDGQGIELHGLRVTGKVDRIDRHEDGRIRLLDYKTAERALKPAQAHIGKARDDTPEWALLSDQVRRWLDLQLPLYKAFLEREFPGNVTVGYFNLPRAVTETGVLEWEELDRVTVLDAVECAGEIARMIRDGRFFPPHSDTMGDALPGLVFDTVEDAVDWDWFQEVLEGWRSDK